MLNHPELNSEDFKSIIRRIHPQNPDPKTIEWAATVIQRGGVVIYPTETFYGLGAHPALEGAIKRVFIIKGRDLTKPLPLIASNIQAVKKVVGEWSELAQRLAEAFWPGPLTLILQASPALSGLLHSFTGKIAIRISSHPVARNLADASGGLLIATSANKAGEDPHHDPDAIKHSFLSLVDGLLHGGRTYNDLPSTIVDVSNFPRKPARLIRSGCLPWEEIRRVIHAFTVRTDSRTS